MAGETLMASIVWKKVWRDLAHNKARTALAVLSTAVGVLALGLVFGLSGVMRDQLTAAHRQALPAHITFRGGPFSPDIVDAVRREPGVLHTEGEIVASFRWKLEGEENWRDAHVVARDDFEDQRMNLLRLVEGRWPTGRLLGIDRLSSEHLGIHPGTNILVEFGGRERRVSVNGVVYAHDVLSPEMGGEMTFYATPETAAWLTGREDGEDYNRLHVRLETYSQEAAEETAGRIKDRLERIELTVGEYEITDPNVHWMQDIVDAVLIILTVMGVLALGLSAFLIINTMNAIIAQQVWQIGVMKAVGATIFRVIDVYLATALIYGGLALLLAVPLGAVGAHLVGVWLLDMLNVEFSTFQIQPSAIAIQTGVGVAVPLLAALVPALGGARVTVRAAISTHGIGGRFGHGWLDRLIGQIHCLPRLMTLGLRNTFRRKGRLTLTLVMLTFSGAMFTMVMSTGASFDSTMMIMYEVGGEVALELERPGRVSRLIEIAEVVPGVTRAEVWNDHRATLSLGTNPERSRGAGPEHNRRAGEEPPVSLRGVPPDSVMFSPRVVSGRSLLPGDTNVVLINHQLAEEEGIQVGDELTVNIDGEESEWTVIGSYLSVNSLSDEFFVPFDALARETGTWGQGSEVMIRSQVDDIESHQRLIKALTDAFTAHRIEVDGSWSASKQWEETKSAFGVLIYLLLTMSILTATVGGIGLMSTMSINVVERTREIGVMRAIGATSLAIVGVFVIEGVFVGVLSWVLAIPLSLPGVRLFGDMIGEAVLEIPLDFAYSTEGLVLWLLIVVVISALASLWPALRAAQVSVREALAYE
jgi:putative ABC transport system permease protein